MKGEQDEDSCAVCCATYTEIVEFMVAKGLAPDENEAWNRFNDSKEPHLWLNINGFAEWLKERR